MANNAIGNHVIISAVMAVKDQQIERQRQANATKKSVVKRSSSNSVNRGAWTVEEDRKLAEAIEMHGPKRWKKVASKAGLNRCGKSCRLRWMNYLRPNIKRGNISDQEEDLILRLHKLLGNRWALIAGRLPGRTDNEIKNYWNSHLSKKTKRDDNRKKIGGRNARGGGEEEEEEADTGRRAADASENTNKEQDVISTKGTHPDHKDTNPYFNVDDLFDFSNDDPAGLEWVGKFFDLGDGSSLM